MHRVPIHVRTVAVAGVAIVGVVAGGALPGAAASHVSARHVILLSVDGMHQSDLTWYVGEHPRSVLAALTSRGVQFTMAQTPVPSDSYPGIVAQATGGNPSSTGIYYDDTYNHALLPPGTSNCATATPGTEVPYEEALDRNPNALDAGQGISPLPAGILNMTANPDTVINPANLPVDPASCQPVYPHSYLRVNTMFEVARAAGLRTAWSDKHPAYEILNGPSGTGVQDLFTPEINSQAPTLGSPIDWAQDNALTQQYDSYKVQAVLNEIDGYDHSRTHLVGTPAIFGMNFQTVSTAQKLPVSDGLKGGYQPDGVTPAPLLRRALDFIDTQVARMVSELHRTDIARDTVIILSAKHGQSPQDPAALTRIDDGAIISAIDAAWMATHPAAAPLVAFAVDDDGMLMWLSDRSAAATSFVKHFLLTLSGTGNGINGNPKPFSHAGLTTVYAGAAAAAYFHVQPGDPRVPDIFGIAQYGVVYTGGTAKIAEHGGTNPQDRHVPLLVAGDPVTQARSRSATVETTQIAPTILALLGLDPNWLQAVQIEHTQVLDLSS